MESSSAVQSNAPAKPKKTDPAGEKLPVAVKGGAGQVAEEPAVVAEISPEAQAQEAEVEAGPKPGEEAIPVGTLDINLATELDTKAIARFALYCVVEEPNQEDSETESRLTALVQKAYLPGVVGDEGKADGQGVIEKLDELSKGDVDKTKLMADDWLKAFEGHSDIIDEVFVEGFSDKAKAAVFGEKPISLREFTKRLAIFRLKCAVGLLTFHEFRKSKTILVHEGERTATFAAKNREKLKGHYQEAEKITTQFSTYIDEMGISPEEMQDYLASEFMLSGYLNASKDRGIFDKDFAHNPYYRSVLFAAMLRYSGALDDADKANTKGSVPAKGLWDELSAFSAWAAEQGIEVGALDIKEDRQWMLFMELLLSYAEKGKEEVEEILRELRVKTKVEPGKEKAQPGINVTT